MDWLRISRMKSKSTQKSTKKQKLVIDRSKWLRGEGSHYSYLLRKRDSKMCCLGFYMLACGASKKSITNVRSPADITDVFTNEGNWLLSNCGGASIDCANLMSVNDDDNEHRNNTREREIVEIFAQHNVEVKFVDGKQAARK